LWVSAYLVPEYFLDGKAGTTNRCAHVHAFGVVLIPGNNFISQSILFNCFYTVSEEDIIKSNVSPLEEYLRDRLTAGAGH
jgi:hypothetical protein